MSKYEQLRDIIISNKELSDEKKVLLLKVLDIYLSFDSEEDALKLEDEIYCLDGRVLSDVERLDIEYTKLCRMNNIIAEQNPKDENAIIFFSKKVDKYAFTKDIIEQKRLLNDYLLDQDEMPAFCSEYGSLLKKYLKLDNILEIDEYKFVKKISR